MPIYIFNKEDNLSTESLESISNILENMNPLEIFEEFYEFIINEAE